MNVLCFMFLGIFIHEITATTGTIYTNHNRNEENTVTEFDNIIQQIENKEWRDHETPCVKKTLEVLHNVKNFTLWAVWIWDSIQHPVGIFYGSRSQLGNYNQCLKTKKEFRTQYCLADIKLTNPVAERQKDVNYYDSAELYLKKPSKYGRDFTSFTWGVCLPEECHPESVSKILEILFRRSYLSPLTNSSITVTSCERGEALQYSTGFYVFITMISVLILVTLLSTLYVSKNTSAKCHEDLQTLQKIAKSFDLVRNYNKLIEDRDDIPAINFLRGISAVGAVHAHHLQLSNAYGVLNGLGLEQDLDNPTTILAKHIEVGLNHFIVISGLLLMKNLMDKEQNLVYFLLKRYIRLMGPIAVMIFYFAVVSPYMGSGPLWSRLNGREQEACVKNWWLVPLTLNNYVNNKDMCQLVYWYIPTDLHLAAFGTLIYFIFRKNRTFGWSLSIVAFVFSTIILGLTTYWDKLPVTLMYGIEEALDLRKNTVFRETYTKSHYRVSRYLIGMAMGYVMSIRKPICNRRLISEKWSTFILTINVLFGLSIWISGGLMIGRQYDAVEAAIFVIIINVFYAVSICITIFIFEYGSVPFIEDVLKLPSITVLSRLSYCIYIVHIAVVQWSVFSTKIPGKYDTSMYFDGTGVFVLSALISFSMWLLVEAPLASLSNILGTRFVWNILEFNDRINTKKIEEYKPRNNGATEQSVEQNNNNEKKKL